MSNKKLTICGIPCEHVVRGGVNGTYRAVFSQADAPLSAVEKIDWNKPAVKGDCLLPAGYGFTVKSIAYEPAFQCTSVELEVAAQYLGDVTGYAAQVAELESQSAAQKQEIAELHSQLAETDEALIALYEAQDAQTGAQEEPVRDSAQEGGEVNA